MNTLQKLEMELKSLSLTLDNIPLTIESIKNNKLTHEKLASIEMFARRAKEALENAEREELLPKTKRITDKLVKEDNERTTIGSVVDVHFASFNKTIRGKIDTGATTSSLDASNIKIDDNKNIVSFVCKELSPNVIIADVVEHQAVISADNKDKYEERPVVKFDVEINGKHIKDAKFNLNDRSHMDTPILIGQNIIKQGEFVVDINEEPTKENVDFSSNIEDTILKLFEQNISFKDMYDILKRKTIKEITY